MPSWRSYLKGYPDAQLCEFLEYGWPMNHTAPLPPQPDYINHMSATAYPEAVNTHLTQEIAMGAIIGPFSSPPFVTMFQPNPLMSRPKRNTDQRRIILNLSWPIGHSTNDGIPSHIYLGCPYKLRLPMVDDLVALILKHGQRCLLYSRDLHRAFSQLRADPLDWPLLGLHWEGGYYFHTSVPFGVRWGSMACQRTTDAVCHILRKEGWDWLCYVDDFAGAAAGEQLALQAFLRGGSSYEIWDLRNLKTKHSHPHTA